MRRKWFQFKCVDWNGRTYDFSVDACTEKQAKEQIRYADLVGPDGYKEVAYSGIWWYAEPEKTEESNERESVQV